MNIIKNVLIMAAGKGERLLPLTSYIPKAMIEYKNKTLIERSIDNLKKYNLKIHVTVGHKGDILSKHLIGLGVNSIFNTDGKDNSWWLFNTMIKYMNEPVLVLTCDNIMEFDLDKITDEYKGEPCLLIPVKVRENIDGDYIHHEGNIVKRLSRTEKSDIYASGCQVIKPHLINSLTPPMDNFNDLWSYLIKNELLVCSRYLIPEWTSVDTMEQLNSLTS